MIFENVFLKFTKTVFKHPDNPALEVNNFVYSYTELYQRALGIASVLLNFPEEQFVGILSYRSFSTYAGILGTLASGKCYVPFNPKFPVERTRKILSLVNCKIFIVDKEFLHLLPEIFQNSNKEIVIITPEIEDMRKSYQFRSIYYDKTNVERQTLSDVPPVNEHNYAYLLFTSGTTGEPKGIPITHSNLTHYIEFMSQNYPVYSTDSCTQLFDTTFDLSVHDMFITWNGAAKLVVIPKNLLFAPIKFLVERKVTIWFSVPSTISFLLKMGILKKNCLPSLRRE